MVVGKAIEIPIKKAIGIRQLRKNEEASLVGIQWVKKQKASSALI